MAITIRHLKDEYGNEFGYLGMAPTNPINHQVVLIDGKACQIHTVVVHKFSLGDVEDPDLYAAEPLIKWQESESGKWVMKHAIETPMWKRWSEPITYGYCYAVVAKLESKKLSEFYLRFDKLKL